MKSFESVPKKEVASNRAHLLHEELQPFYDKRTGILSHPLVYCYTLPDEQGIFQMNEAYGRLKARRDDYIGKTRFPLLSYLILHRKPYLLFAFIKVAHLISDAQYWRGLGIIWSMTELCSPDQTTWLELFQAERRYRRLLMDRAERRFFDALPDELTIYRGYQKGRRKMGLSWTLSKERAVWFANRYTSDGRLARVVIGTCKKADVIFYSNGRSEEEIVIDPKKISTVRLLKDCGTACRVSRLKGNG